MDDNLQLLKGDVVVRIFPTEKDDDSKDMSIPGGFTPQFRRLETGVPM
ncbi:MAG: hypothetical protein ACLU8C_02595 [Lacrimispora saccharolytica]